MAELTIRASVRAVDRFRCYDTTISAPAQMLGVDENTVRDTITLVVQARISTEDRLALVNS